MDAIVKIEFGSRCNNHGMPEYLKLSGMLRSFFPNNVGIFPFAVGYFNHFRVYVGEHLIFDSYSRYPPVIEVVKCIEEYQNDIVPGEIPYHRGIPFGYWLCPEHEGLLVEGQATGYAPRTTQRLSCISSKVTTDTSSSSENTGYRLSREIKRLSKMEQRRELNDGQ